MRKMFLLLLLVAGTTSAYSVSYKYGTIKGVFSVASGKKVVFSQGNLQYQASTGTWRFATNQYDVVGNASVGNVSENEEKCNNALIADDYTGWIDLFGWNTSAAPTQTTESDPTAAFVDWGANKISNAYNKANQWRTLSRDEWLYLFNNRPNAAALFGQGCVEGINGMIVLSDDWVPPTAVTFTPKPENFTTNVYTASEWKEMEKNGALFLPACGWRSVPNVSQVNEVGGYFSSDQPGATSTSNLIHIHFTAATTSVAGGSASQKCAWGVRLVADCFQEVNIGVVYPEAGQPSQPTTLYPSSPNYGVVGKVTLPDDAPYEVVNIGFYSADGNSYSESKFNPNTTYKMQVVLRPKLGYSFPMSPGTDDYPDRTRLAAIVNGETLSSFNCWKSNTIGLTMSFTTGDADILATPVYSYNGWGFQDTAHLAITCATEGAKIYYTTDGTTPSKTHGTLYEQPIWFNVTPELDGTNVVVKAISTRDDEVSDVVSHSFRLYRTECTITPHFNAEQGSATVTPATAKYGDQVAITVEPIYGYTLDTLYMNGRSEKIENFVYTIPASRTSLTLMVLFKAAERVKNVAVSAEFPKAGKNVPSGAIVAGDPLFNVLGKATVAPGANYGVAEYEFGDADGNPIETAQFAPYTKYTMAVTLATNEGYCFPLAGGIVDDSQITATINEVDPTSTSVGATTFTVVTEFTTGEVDPTAINNIENRVQTTKVIRDGQLIIRHNGKTFNAIGQEVK